MAKSVDATLHEFGSVRTGRASPALLDRISVDYYGAITPLKQLATISTPEARLLSIQPYDKTSIKAIERAILESDIGLTPSNDGNLIRLVVPELTEERRKEIRVHLDWCGPCNGAAGFEAELRKVIANRCKDHVPDSLVARVAEALQEEYSHQDG
jgi:mycothiol system anti-sigma-R factor